MQFTYCQEDNSYCIIYHIFAAFTHKVPSFPLTQFSSFQKPSGGGLLYVSVKVVNFIPRQSIVVYCPREHWGTLGPRRLCLQAHSFSQSRRCPYAAVPRDTGISNCLPNVYIDERTSVCTTELAPSTNTRLRYRYVHREVLCETETRTTGYCFCKTAGRTTRS